jgi:hypothetical protein
MNAKLLATATQRKANMVVMKKDVKTRAAASQATTCMDGIRASSLDVWLLRAEEVLGAPACQSFEGATEISGASTVKRICLAIPDKAG